jgi:hypothetical protein
MGDKAEEESPSNVDDVSELTDTSSFLARYEQAAHWRPASLTSEATNACENKGADHAAATTVSAPARAATSHHSSGSSRDSRKSRGATSKSAHGDGNTSAANSDGSRSLLLSIAGHLVMEKQKEIDQLKQENKALMKEKEQLVKDMREVRYEKEQKDIVVMEALQTMARQHQLLTDMMKEHVNIKQKLEQSTNSSSSSLGSGKGKKR